MVSLGMCSIDSLRAGDEEKESRSRSGMVSDDETIAINECAPPTNDEGREESLARKKSVCKEGSDLRC